MELTFEKLIKFDLEKELEEALLQKGKQDQIIEFLKIFHEIISVDNFIRDCPSSPGSTDKIIRSEMVYAIGSTLAIEGGNLLPEEIEESFQKADRQEQLLRSEQEAENSRKVYEFIIKIVKKSSDEFFYSEQIIRQIHKYFTEGLNYLGNVPGQYRGEFPTRFGYPPRTGLCRNNSEVDMAMRNFAKWLNKQEGGFLNSNIIVKAIMAHYYLTEIHPFADGNGRTARALEALILYKNHINPYCFWSLANFWYLNRSNYIQQLSEIRLTCNPWKLLIWGMKGYLQEIKRIKGRVRTKVKELMFRDYIRYLLFSRKEQKIKINPKIESVLLLLIEHGRTALSEFQYTCTQIYNVSPLTMQRYFQKLEKLHLIKVSKEDREKFIEPNFEILETLTYK